MEWLFSNKLSLLSYFHDILPQVEKISGEHKRKNDYKELDLEDDDISLGPGKQL